MVIKSKRDHLTYNFTIKKYSFLKNLEQKLQKTRLEIYNSLIFNVGFDVVKYYKNSCLYFIFEIYCVDFSFESVNAELVFLLCKLNLHFSFIT